ncbi:MAG TPA: hypothetical protein DD490_11455 [Acidobacteria bacterium]|nr:hypothetical protein [Acidobacteriota bacterium]
MKSWKTAAVALCAFLAGALPALAGEVYVPFASNRVVGTTTYQTKVWISNPSAAARKFSVRFISKDTDGTVGAGTGTELTVPAGGTLLLGSVAPSGSLGMVEISGATQLVINARIEAIGTNGAILSSANVPMASGANKVKENTNAHLQGLEITSRGTISDLGLLNLSTTAAQCTIKAFRSNGTQIGQTSVISVLPLATRHFENALSTLGETAVSDARFDVTCTKSFFPYAVVFKAGGPETNFITASSALDTSVLGGGGGPVDPETMVFQVAGLFHDAKLGASYKEYELPLVEGVAYKKATVEFDLATATFPNGVFTGLSELRRSDRTLYYSLILRNDRTKTLLDLGNEVLLQGRNNGPWRPRQTYRIVIDYDTVAGQVTFRLFQNGSVVETLNGRTSATLTKNGKTRIIFGLSEVFDNAYFPPIGFKYSNLKVTFTP